jgi:hypothetical protein
MWIQKCKLASFQFNDIVWEPQFVQGRKRMRLLLLCNTLFLSVQLNKKSLACLAYTKLSNTALCKIYYQVKCTGHPACSGRPSHITIADLCDGGICLDAPFHFDMSGTAFGSMSFPGRANELRHAGRLAIDFTR